MGTFMKMAMKFQDEELAPICPEELLHWMDSEGLWDFKNPGPNDHLTECHSNTIASYQKSISYYLPNQSACFWNAISGVGNPSFHQGQRPTKEDEEG